MCIYGNFYCKITYKKKLLILCENKEKTYLNLIRYCNKNNNCNNLFKL